MGKAETNLTKHMIEDGYKVYGHERIVIIKYHGNEYSRAGVSDLLVCLDGGFAACEVKAPESYGGSVERALDKGPSTLQKSFINKVLIANGVAAVVATRGQFLETLVELDHRNRDRCAYCQFPDEWEGPCPIHPPSIPIPIYKV